MAVDLGGIRSSTSEPTPALQAPPSNQTEAIPVAAALDAITTPSPALAGREMAWREPAPSAGETGDSPALTSSGFAPFPRDEWETLADDPGPLIASLLPALLALALLLLLVRALYRRLERVAKVVIEVLGDQRDGRAPRRVRFGGRGPLEALARRLERFSSELLVARRENEEWIRQLEQERERAGADARRAVLRLAATCRRVHPELDELAEGTTRLLATDVDEEQRELISGLERRAEGLREIADDLHLLARIEAGAWPARETPFALHEAIEGIAESYAERLRDRRVELVLDLDPGLPRTIVGDPLRLELVLARLLESAVRTTTHGFVSIRLAPFADRRGVPQLSLTVADSGLGRSPESLALLVDPRLGAGTEASEPDDEELSLAVVGGLVEALGGVVTVDSCPDEGTAVEVVLPCLAGDDPAEPSLPLVPAYHRVLVVDDLAERRRATGTLLSRLQLKVETASGIDWALAMLSTASEEENPFDLLVVDAPLDGGCGLDLVHRVRADSAIAETEVLLLSSRGAESDPDGLEAAGHTHCRSRPVRLADWTSFLLREEESPEVPDPEAPLPAQPQTTRGPLLLLVQGPSSDRDLTGRLLEELGCRVSTATHGAEARERLAERSIDLVLIDCRTPALDGFGISRSLRTLPEPAGSKPIVALTDNATFADHGACMAAGIDDCLPASSTGEALARALSRHLHGWASAGR